jgi:acetolactate decarboxylase
MTKITSLLVAVSILCACSSPALKPHTEVTIVGQMKNVMWKGELFGNIHLDTISNKKNLYGLGPLEYLSGEVLIMDGKSYQSKVVSDTSMLVEETFDIKAPFFGYATISDWNKTILHDSIQTIAQLETYIDQISATSKRPFLFKLSAEVETAHIHVVNLPKGTKVSNPDEAHQGQVNYEVKHTPVDILGFFSTEHQTIFTHHDTYLHMHLITRDKKQMGHVDDIIFTPGSITLFLPK